MDKIGYYTINQVHMVNCVEGMNNMPDQSVDIAIADPPYNLSKGNNWKWDNSVKLKGFGGNWEKVMAAWDTMPLGDYFNFTLQWLTELKRVVKPTGSIWIHGTYHNIGIINFALQILDIEIINEVVWFKRNSFPNLSGRRLTASHETIIWAHTGKKRQYLFNYEESKNMNCPEDNLKSPGKQMRTVWDVPNNKDREELKYGKHPTQKPVRLLKRMIEISAKKGQICLVPFAGSGSECVAAHGLGLDFIGFETDKEFVNLCKKRMSFSKTLFDCEPEKEEKTNSQVPSLIKWTGSKRSQANSIHELIPVHNRYIEPFVGSGAVLFLAAKKGDIASDIYQPLIDLWHLVQEDPEQLIENYNTQWESLQKELPQYYYVVRDNFNKNPNPLDLNFLLRTCVNGIVRFNSKGEFNNSFHLSRKGMQPDNFESIVFEWHQKVREVTFLCQDYMVTIESAKKGDFIYFDPPYAGNKQRYAEDLDVDKFFRNLEILNSRCVKWALSFDGMRGDDDLRYPVPEELYKKHVFLKSGHSTAGKVLNKSLEEVHESLYLNY